MLTVYPAITTKVCSVFCLPEKHPPIEFIKHNPENRARRACVAQSSGRAELAYSLRSKPVIFLQCFTEHSDSAKISDDCSVLPHSMNRDIQDPGYTSSGVTAPQRGAFESVNPSLSGDRYVPFPLAQNPPCAWHGEGDTGRYYLNSCRVNDWAQRGHSMHARDRFFAVRVNKHAGPRYHHAFRPRCCFGTVSRRAETHKEPHMRTTFRNSKHSAVRFSP